MITLGPGGARRPEHLRCGWVHKPEQQPRLGPRPLHPLLRSPQSRRLGRGCNGGCGLSRLRGPRPLVQPPKPAIAGQSPPKVPPTNCTPPWLITGTLRHSPHGGSHAAGWPWWSEEPDLEGKGVGGGLC